MFNEKSKLTSSEIGTLWVDYVNGTMIDCVNKYMLSIIEDKSIKNVFEEAINIFQKQKAQIVKFLKDEGFPVPQGFGEADFNKNTERLFSDIFCLQYLNLMTIHGLAVHITALGVSIRKDLRQTFDSFDNEGKNIFHKTTELLLEKGQIQRDPYIYPEEDVKFIENTDFTAGLFKPKRPLSAVEMVSVSLNIKKNILAKSLSIAFSQVVQAKELRQFLLKSQDAANAQIMALARIMQNDNLPVPKSWETEITTSQQSPFSDRLMLSHIGFLYQAGQGYHGVGLASAMRADLVTTYEKIILKNISVTKKWAELMIKHKWLEQPPLEPNRKEIAKDK